MTYTQLYKLASSLLDFADTWDTPTTPKLPVVGAPVNPVTAPQTKTTLLFADTFPTPASYESNTAPTATDIKQALKYRTDTKTIQLNQAKQQPDMHVNLPQQPAYKYSNNTQFNGTGALLLGLLGAGGGLMMTHRQNWMWRLLAALGLGLGGAYIGSKFGRI